MPNKFLPRIGLMLGDSGTSVTVIRWWRLGVDVIRSPGWTLVQFGLRGKMPLHFICKVAKGGAPPAKIQSARWVIKRIWGWFILGTTARPFNTSLLFRLSKPTPTTPIPHNRRLHGGNTSGS